MPKVVKSVYKRTIIQVPMKDYEMIKKYALKYNLSVSSAFVMLSKKALENETIIEQVPEMLKLMNKRVVSAPKNERARSSGLQ